MDATHNISRMTTEAVHNISSMTAVCAARHFIELHSAALEERKSSFTAPCEACPCFSECRADWADTLAPIFKAAGIKQAESSTWSPL